MAYLRMPSEPVKVMVPRLHNRGTVPLVFRWQEWHDPERDAARTLRWYGACVGCLRNLYGFDDGHNDQRGVLGDNALATLPVTGVGGRAPAREWLDVEVRLCPLCRGDRRVTAMVRSDVQRFIATCVPAYRVWHRFGPWLWGTYSSVGRSLSVYYTG